MEGRRIKEIDVLRINAGLSCDGDTIAMTAATQPRVAKTRRNVRGPFSAASQKACETEQATQA
jgi:hypothetical protein